MILLRSFVGCSQAMMQCLSECASAGVHRRPLHCFMCQCSDASPATLAWQTVQRQMHSQELSSSHRPLTDFRSTGPIYLPYTTHTCMPRQRKYALPLAQSQQALSAVRQALHTLVCLRAADLCHSSMSWGLATLPTNFWPNLCALMVEKPV